MPSFVIRHLVSSDIVFARWPRGPSEIVGKMSIQEEERQELEAQSREDNRFIINATEVDIGDIGIAYATVYHGVAPVNTFKEPNWDDMNDGRWFLSLYSNESDEVKSRHTGYTVNEKLSLKGVTPF